MGTKNNWYVITGGPYAGKTTLINLLGEKGFKIIQEAARILIDEELAKGKTLAEIREDEQKFQEKILGMKLGIEKKLSKNEIIFFDRGIHDTEAYYNLYGFKIDNKLKQIFKNNTYKKVFLLDPLEYKKDYARTESKEQQLKIYVLLAETYKKIGIPLLRVPVMNSELERLEFILENL